MSIKTRFLIWIIVIHLLMTSGCVLIFRTNLIWFLCSLVFIAISAVISLWIWYGLVKSDRVSVTCLEMLKEQDFSSRLRRVGYPEGDRMIEVYNRMIAELRKQRLQIRGKNEFLDLLIEASSMGIIIFDFDMSITSVNPAAAKFLKISRSKLIGHRLNEFDNILAKTLSNLSQNKPYLAETGNFNRYRCSLLSFIDSGFNRPFILIEEITHELIAAEKQASAKVIRTMSHEVNNTLSSINSNLSVLLGFENYFPENLRPDIIRALQLSIERSDNLCKLVSDFSDIVKLPPPSITPLKLNELVKNTVNLMQSDFIKADVKCTLQLSDISPLINADFVQIEQALINILKNALEASIETKGEVTVTTSHPATLIIRDTGCGIPEELQDKIFTPFFTTKPSGQGIGLMLVYEILINHNFAFDLQTKEGFTEFKITF